VDCQEALKRGGARHRLATPGVQAAAVTDQRCSISVC
jgi:hypothetical protein